MFTEWVYVNNTWEIFGSVAIDLSGYLTDVQVNGASIVSDGVANVPIASGSGLGVVKINTTADNYFGIGINDTGALYVSPAGSQTIKNSTDGYRPICVKRQHESTFYGLAKVAGYDEKNSALPVGQYSEEAKAAIQSMLNVPSTDDVQDLQTAVQEKADADAVSSLIEQIYNAHPNVEAETASVVSITDGADGIPVKSLIVGIEPVQDLHGYDSPWPAGGGKNLLDPSTVSALGNTVWFCEPNGFLFNGGVSYTFSVSNVDDVDSIAIYATDKSTRLAYSTDSTRQSVTYTPTEDAYGLPRLYRATAITQAIVDGTMIEVGSSRTTYAPYSNICPIIGWTGANVQRTGVNVWDEEWEVGAYSGTTGEKITNKTNMRCKNAIPVKPNTAYYIKSPYAMYAFEYSADGTYLGYTTILNNTMTTKANSCYMRFYLLAGYGTTYNNDISINYPSTVTSYEPYQGQTYDIEFPSEAGTVYGGTLDVTNGTLTVDRAMADLGTLTWRYHSVRTRFETYGVQSTIKPSTNNNTPTNALCESYKIVPASAVQSTDFSVGVTNIGVVLVHDSRYSDADTYKAAVSGVQLVYELETPITYTLTPQEVETLLGVNNLWADTGDTSLAYRADTRLYVERLTASD